MTLRIARLLVLLFCCPSLFAQVRYSISLADPEHHVVRVQYNIPRGRPSHELQLPVWNALYQIRDFVQYMNWIHAEDASGHALPIKQLNKSRWMIAGAETGARIEYEMLRRTAQFTARVFQSGRNPLVRGRSTRRARAG